MHISNQRVVHLLFSHSKEARKINLYDVIQWCRIKTSQSYLPSLPSCDPDSEVVWDKIKYWVFLG